MTTTLSEGVKVPDVGSVNWAGDLEVNWNLLNGALANLSFNVKLDRDNIWTGEQSFTLPIVGSITGTASKAIADEDGNSIKSTYGKLAGDQTWTGTNAFRNINPETNSTYSLGSSTLRWSSVYADSYYYGTTAFTDKFVTVDTEQTISKSLTPSVTATHSLGTSTNKWKTINGYEPSTLSEVYIANEVTIDTTGWTLDGSAWNTLDTSIMSGWVYFAVTNCDADSFILFKRGSNKAKNPTICFHPQHANSGTYYLYGLFMVPKNTTCIIAIKTGTNGVLTQALLYPCFGNV